MCSALNYLKPRHLGQLGFRLPRLIAFASPKNATRLLGGNLNHLRALNSFGEDGQSSLCSRVFSLLILVMP